MNEIFTIIDPNNVPFKYRKLKNDPKYKYELTHEYSVQTGIILDRQVLSEFYFMNRHGFLIAQPGFKWDGVSGPMIDTKNSMRGGCVHDIGYRMIRRKQISLHFKHAFDLEFKKIMQEDWEPWTIFGDTWNWCRANYAYLAVHWFGHSSCVPGSEEE